MQVHFYPYNVSSMQEKWYEACHSVGNFVRAGTNKDAYAKGIPSGKHDILGVFDHTIYNFLQNSNDAL